MHLETFLSLLRQPEHIRTHFVTLPAWCASRYKEIRYEENYESLTIMNTSQLEADINFCFLNDSKGDTFLLDPPTMLLKPGAKQVRPNNSGAETRS